MLLQFSVENFKSFKDKAVLSLEASSDKELQDHVVSVGKERLLKSVALFGANSAGKSNLFEALTAAIVLVRQSNHLQYGAPFVQIVPFRFDESCAGKPSSFEFVFFTHGKKYVYGFSATRERVIEEYLYVYNSSRASVVFERTNTNDYRFTSPAIRKKLLPLVEMNTDNKLFLATATAWNAEETRDAYLWFEQMIHICSSDDEVLLKQTMAMYAQDDDSSLHYFVCRLFQEADTQITDYEIISKPDTIHELSIETIHRIEKDGEEQLYRLPLEKESKGVRWLFAFAPVLKKAFETGGIICVDDFGADLHPLLVEYLISLFHNPDVNQANAQLIVSTQTMLLMSSDVLRSDEIYFVEKDYRNGESELFPMDAFSKCKGEDYLMSYLHGRFGAIPFIFDAQFSQLCNYK